MLFKQMYRDQISSHFRSVFMASFSGRSWKVRKINCLISRFKTLLLLFCKKNLDFAIQPFYTSQQTENAINR